MPRSDNERIKGSSTGIAKRKLSLYFDVFRNQTESIFGSSSSTCTGNQLAESIGTYTWVDYFATIFRS